MSTESKQDPSGANACPVCGGALTAGVPGGLCAKCLMEGASAPTEPGGVGPMQRHGPPEVGRLAEVFPELEIKGLVGVGGMGAVFQARQPHLDRWVALKVLPEALAANPAFAERFNREARTLARLNHPNIVTVHDFGRRGGFYFLLMEFIDGVNLRQAMRAGRLTPQEALGLVPKICEALQFAHEEGVLHRDIKPENILLDGRGRVKIADFGIAKLVGEAAADQALTMSGAALGTPAYMAPEQIENPSAVDHRADIYSLGVVLYEMLTGELPLGRFAPPSEKGPVDRRVDEIVMRALAKERELRQQSANQVRTEVEGVTRAVSSAGTPGLGFEPRGGAAGVPTEPDFVLCNPRLPSMAQWITVYTLLVPLVFWFVGLAGLEETEDSSPYAQFVGWLQNGVTVVGDLGVVGLLMVGGWKLRALKVSGPRLIRAGLWAHLILGGVVMGLQIWIERLRWNDASEAESVTPGEVLVVLAALAAIAFEISALVWLRRHAHRLALVFAGASPESADAAAEVAMTAPTSGVARHATLSAWLTGMSVAIGLVGMVGGSILGAMLFGSRSSGVGAGIGLGPAEFGLAFLGLLIVLGGVVTGAFLGWSALGEIRRSGGRQGGVGRGLFAGLAWPLVVGELAVLVGLGWVFYRIGGSFWIMALMALAAVLGVGELLVRSAWRWVRNLPRGERTGRLPGSGRALVVGSALTVLLTFQVGFSLIWLKHMRSRIPEMVAVVGPSLNAAEPGEWEVAYPPRSMVWLSTAVYREGVRLAGNGQTAHVLNGSLWDSVTAPVRVMGVGDLLGEPGRWRWDVVTDRHTVAFEAPLEPSRGVRWLPPAEEGVPVRVGVRGSEEIGVLVGQGSDGSRWEVRLTIRVEPLTPAFLFEGAIAGQGEDWEKTAASAVSLEESKTDE